MLTILTVLFLQDPALFSDTRLKLTDRADQAVIEDVDGDGKPDLVVQSGRDLRLFPFRDAGISPDAGPAVKLDGTSFLWAFSRMADARQRVLIAMGSRGLVRHPWRDGAWAKAAEDLVIHPSLFEGQVSDGKAPLYSQFPRDMNGDGLDDGLLFTATELLIFPQVRGEGGRPDFRLGERLRVPTESTLASGWMAHQRLTETVRTPLLSFGDINGDKRPDITWVRQDVLGTFLQNEDGTFGAAAARDLAIKKVKVRNTYIKFEAPPILRDLNGDGLHDVVIDYPSKGRINVFINRLGRTDFTSPDEVISVDGWTPGVEVVDLDRDGKLEIAVGVIRKLGLMSGIDAFTTKKVRLEMLLFRLNDRGQYTNEPVQQLEFQIPYVFQATRESASIDLTFRPNFSCDINGDGMTDLLIEKEQKALEVYLGIKDRLMSTEPAFEIPLSPPERVSSFSVVSSDINDDRKSDLVILYRTSDRKGDQVQVKLSK